MTVNINIMFGKFLVFITFLNLNIFVRGFNINKNTFYRKHTEKKYNKDDISINELFNKIDNKLLSKLLIHQNGNEVYSLENINNEPLYHHTLINPLIIKNVIQHSLNSNIDISFYNNIFDNLDFLLNGFITVVFISIIFSAISTFITFSSYNFNSNSTDTNKFKFNGLNSLNSLNPFGNKFNLKKNSFDAKKYNISIDSWVGSPEVFEECYEIISYINNSTNYKKLDAKLPKGILLEGPPGVGKTLLAKVIASETSSNFISVSASEFIELFVGVGASRIRDLFREARTLSPCIVFIDEIDAIGKQRGISVGGNDERDQTINQLLSEMDGFNDNDGVIILAATNRKEILDSALLRPGRFDRVVRIELPDKQSREQILNLYLNSKPVEDNIDIGSISELTEGFSGSELSNLVNDAAILSARQGLDYITENNIYNAFEKVIVGIPKKIDNRAPETKIRISCHEVGHALLVLYFSKFFNLQKISIKSTNLGAGGYTIFTEQSKYKNDGLYTKELLYNRLIITLGGKAAESICYGTDKVSLGARQDLKEANELARKMIGLFGMGNNKLETFYNSDIEYDDNNNNKYSEKTKHYFDSETIKLVSSAYKDAIKIIEKNKNIFYELTTLLYEKTILNPYDINDFLKNKTFDEDSSICLTCLDLFNDKN